MLYLRYIFRTSPVTCRPTAEVLSYHSLWFFAICERTDFMPPSFLETQFSTDLNIPIYCRVFCG